MVELILGIIEGSLELVNKLVPEESTRIRNKILNYRREWDAEMAKGHLRDDANLDRLDRELRDIGELFLATIKGSQSKDKP